MVSALDSGSSGPGSSPGRDTVMRSLAKHLINSYRASFRPGVQTGTGEFNSEDNPTMD